MHIKVLAILMVLSVNCFGVSFKTMVPFTGKSAPAATFFYDLPYKMALSFGFTSEIPASKTEELDVDLILGIVHSYPLIGRVNSYLTFDNHGGRTLVGGYQKSEFYTKSLSFSKSWLYPVTQHINMGLNIVLAEIMLEGSYEVKAMNFMGVMSTTISF